MKCHICSKGARIKEFENRYICDRCFSRKIEKRVRKLIRIEKLFSRGDKIVVKDPICKFLLENILKDLQVKFVSKGKVVIPNSLDDELVEFLNSMFYNKKVKKLSKKYVKILKVVKDDELKEFARINKLKFKPLRKDKKIMHLLDVLDLKYPNAKFNLFKNIKMLNRLTDKFK